MNTFCKRIAALLFSLVLTFIYVGCGQNHTNNSTVPLATEITDNTNKTPQTSLLITNEEFCGSSLFHVGNPSGGQS